MLSRFIGTFSEKGQILISLADLLFDTSKKKGKTFAYGSGKSHPQNTQPEPKIVWNAKKEGERFQEKILLTCKFIYPPVPGPMENDLACGGGAKTKKIARKGKLNHFS